jgi:phosphomannomutase
MERVPETARPSIADAALVVVKIGSSSLTGPDGNLSTTAIQGLVDALAARTEDGTRVCVRPSGTEPKIKFYFGVKATLPSVADYEKVRAELNDKIERIKKELKLV